VDVGISVGNGVGVKVSVGSGVNVSGTDVAGSVSVGETFVGENSISGEGEAGVSPPVKLHARVVRTRNKGNTIFFIPRLYLKNALAL
jgi:hypothetical protein